MKHAVIEYQRSDTNSYNLDPIEVLRGLGILLEDTNYSVKNCLYSSGDEHDPHRAMDKPNPKMLVQVGIDQDRDAEPLEQILKRDTSKLDMNEKTRGALNAGKVRTYYDRRDDADKGFYQLAGVVFAPPEPVVYCSGRGSSNIAAR